MQVAIHPQHARERSAAEQELDKHKKAPLYEMCVQAHLCQCARSLYMCQISIAERHSRDRIRDSSRARDLEKMHAHQICTLLSILARSCVHVLQLLEGVHAQ
jgi:hypothetical protein